MMDENEIKISEIRDKSKFLGYYKKYMLIVGILGQLLFYSQGFKIFVTKSANDVSLAGFLFGFVSVSSWMTYGFLIKDRPLIVANVFAVIGALFVIAGILIHRGWS